MSVVSIGTQNRWKKKNREIYDYRFLIAKPLKYHLPFTYPGPSDRDSFSTSLCVVVQEGDRGGVVVWVCPVLGR